MGRQGTANIGQVLIIAPALPFSPADLPGEDARLAFWLEMGNSLLSPFSGCVIAIRRPGVYTSIFVRWHMISEVPVLSRGLQHV